MPDFKEGSCSAVDCWTCKKLLRCIERLLKRQPRLSSHPVVMLSLHQRAFLPELSHDLTRVSTVLLVDPS